MDDYYGAGAMRRVDSESGIHRCAGRAAIPADPSQNSSPKTALRNGSRKRMFSASQFK